MKEDERRIEILSRIINGEEFSKHELADEFKVSEITISRDLNYFRSSGIEIYSKNKKLVIQNEDNDNSLYRYLENHFTSSPEYLSIKPPYKTSRLFFLNTLTYINICIRKNLGLQIFYTSLSDNTENKYLVLPQKLILNGYNWILEAVDIKDGYTKTFYISRMLNITSAKIPSPKKRSKKDIEIYKMHFRFNKHVAEQIKSKKWFEDYNIEVLEDGRIDLIFHSEITDKIAGWCVGWWDQIEIISPAELKNYIKEMITHFSKKLS